ncbi:hypothetical protein [Streptomyces antimycoticus]|nr:hypothetical protein [Streptomyces antimycoticus]WJD94725.1 hypothetical protein QR300_01110 [Streptomyces antimycoticus]
MDRLWDEASHRGSSLLYRVDAAKSLMNADFAALADRHLWVHPVAI